MRRSIRTSSPAEQTPRGDVTTPSDARLAALVVGEDRGWEQPSPAERLAALDAAAGRYLEAACPEHTRHAYATDWRAWEDYTNDLGIPPYAATVSSLVGFVRWFEVTRTYAPATVDRRLAGAVAGLKKDGPAGGGGNAGPAAARPE